MGDTMKYSGLIRNDLAAAPGVSVSFFTQGCPHRCKGCHNPETWDFEGGKEFTPEVLHEIYDALAANGVERSFCIMGGEPMCQENLFLTCMLLQNIKLRFPQVKIYLWTGYYYEQLLQMADPKVELILDMVDVLIDGPYDEKKRDITLKMRGSSNQSIIDLKEKRECQK
jgi:anaerobic ribonucleoside-triphosphate reductase activating protein